jgi:SAM-dependent methyltransferase
MARSAPLYDRIGVGYANKRQPDPRWAAQIEHALGDAGTILNVGAGTGSYEPRHRDVFALDPSPEMIAQRRHDAAPVVRGVAADLPFPDASFDATLAVLTLHHWPDSAAGLAEMRRVSRRQVIVTWDVDLFASSFWFTRDYLPSVGPAEHRHADAALVAAQLDHAEIRPLLVPHDCADGFFAAYWRRPEAYLDPAVRASVSGLAIRDETELGSALTSLEADLKSGAWRAKYADLLERDEFDMGYRLVIGSAWRDPSVSVILTPSALHGRLVSE